MRKNYSRRTECVWCYLYGGSRLITEYWATTEIKLNKPTAHMSYANYDADIRLCHRVQLRGWPNSVKFAPPATITAKADILLLLDSLKEGECIWVTMTTQEVTDLKTQLKNGAQRKPRATRKDKGGTHKTQKE